MLCLACRREASDTPDRILIARIGASQEGDQQAIQVRNFPSTAMCASAAYKDLVSNASTTLPASGKIGSLGILFVSTACSNLRVRFLKELLQRGG